jgi:hypothetical protein
MCAMIFWGTIGPLLRCVGVIWFVFCSFQLVPMRFTQKNSLPRKLTYDTSLVQPNQHELTIHGKSGKDICITHTSPHPCWCFESKFSGLLLQLDALALIPLYTRRKLAHFNWPCDLAIATHAMKMHKQINLVGNRGGTFHG